MTPRATIDAIAPRVRSGRRGLVVLGLLGTLVGAGACNRDADEGTPGKGAAADPAADVEGKGAAGAEGADAPTPPEPTTPVSLLVGVLDHAIEAPPEGGSTYRVDAYVAALAAEQLRRDPQPFTAWRGDDSDPSQPAAGYRVGPLAPDSVWSRLGLHEGDIIEEVNGVSTAEPGWAADALRRGENNVTVSLFREDVYITLAYRLMGGLAWNALVQSQLPVDGGAGAGEAGLDPDAIAAAEVDPSDPGLEPDPERIDPSASGSTPLRTPPSSRPSSGSGSGSRPSSPSSPRPSTGGSTPRPSPSPSAVARCSSATRCTLDKGYFDSIVRSPSKLQSQANVVPAIRDDVFSGYKLKSVKRGGAVEQLGFRSGDKITHINGKDLTNDYEAMALYMGLSSTKVFNVRYVRGGSTLTKTITVV